MQRLVVIGTSAGGIEALRDLVAHLPIDFPSPIAIVMHTSPQSPGLLHEILSRSGPLPALNPHGGERLRPGHIYIAPPDYHLLIEPGRMRVSKGPKENRFRPAIDPLFRSAAQVYGPGAIGVIMTGNLDDGTAGLWAIKRLGGTAIVQDPDDALFPSMPEHALRAVAVDHRVPLRDIAPLLVKLTTAPVVAAPETAAHKDLEIEVEIANEQDPLKMGVEQLGAPSAIACPECHGVLREWKEDTRLRFRCHTGHAYSADSLLAEIGEGVETSMWNAIRALQEGSMLMRRLAAHADLAHSGKNSLALRERADALEKQADAMRDMMHTTSPLATEPVK